MSDPPRTVIEFVDKTAFAAHKVQEIRINGIPVLVAEDGASIEFGANEATAVTLRILPTEVLFTHAPRSQP